MRERGHRTVASNVVNLVIGRLNVASEAGITAEEVTHAVNHQEEAATTVVTVVAGMTVEMMDALKS